MSFIVQPQTLFAIGPSRSFGGIQGYCTITENAVDAIEITQQPVQQGASIADHAFKKPVSFSMQIQFQASLFGQSLAQIYQSLLTLQSSFQPFSVITPKRTYGNMLFASLGMTTDKKTENVLSIAASFQEVILVPVLTTHVPRSQLRNAGSNGATQAVGKKSALLSLAQGVGAAP
jgi:hypothetical protein